MQVVFCHYPSVFQSEVESVHFYHVLFIFCFAFMLLKHSKNFIVIIIVYTVRSKFNYIAGSKV